MPKGCLEFQLPEEQEEYEACVKVADIKGVLHDMIGTLRQKVKYGDDLTDEQHELVSELYKEFWDICRSRGVDTIL